jgi:uncharacterized protein
VRIALIADTHIPTRLARLPGSLLDRLAQVDAVLHAGDIVTHDVLDELSAIAPTTAVPGNMDPPELSQRLNPRELLSLEGWTIGLHHGHQPHEIQLQYITSSYDAPEMDVFFQQMHMQLPGAQIIVFGHFHRPLIRWWHEILFINPGSVVPTHGVSSFAELELAETAHARILTLNLSPPTERSAS